MFTLMWRSHYNLQALYETPTLPAGDEDAAGAREVAGSIVDAARARGPDRAHRVRVEAASWPPTASRPSRPASPPTEDEAVAAAVAIGYPVVLKLHSRHDHAQDRRRRRAAQPGGCRGGPPRLPVDRGIGARTRRPGAFRRRQRAADGPARRLRADRRQQPGPAVRPGAPLRHRRPARRGLPRPRAGPAAAEHDAGPPDDGADAHLHRAEGRARPAAGRPRGARAAPGAVQRPGGRAALDQGDRHQPAAGLARAAAGAWTRG